MNWLKVTLLTMGAAYLVWKGFSRSKVVSPTKRSADRHVAQTPSTSADELAAALAAEKDPLERHWISSRHVEQAYRNRDNDEQTKARFYQYAHRHLAETSGNVDELIQANNGKMPPVVTFKLLAMALEADGKYEEAVAVCENAITVGVKDGTKTGFEGRIDRLKKKLGKE